jgi:hypothetical protein
MNKNPEYRITKSFMQQIICAGAIALMLPVATIAEELQVIALGGTQAPGMPEGTNFNTSGFERPAVNALGQVAFHAVVQPSRDTIYFGFPDTLQPVAMEGDTAPGSGGQVFCNLSFSNPEPVIIPADDGTLAFSGLVKDPESLRCSTTTEAVGIWQWSGAQLTLVALEGQQAADAAEGLIYSDIHPVFRYGNAGVLFRATLRDTGSGENLGVGLWAGLPGALELVAFEGEAAADQPALVYEGFAQNLFINNPGEASFWTWHQGNGSDRTRYAGAPGALNIRWREGADASDFADGYFFTGPAQNQPDEWGINDASEVCFSSTVDHAELTAEDTLWVDTTVDRALLASQSGSDPLLGGGYRYANFQNCWINEKGKVLFSARVDTDPQTGLRSGLWTIEDDGDGPALELVTAWGDTLNGDVGSYPVTTKLTPGEPHINGLGHVVFEVNVTDSTSEPVTDRNSIWLIEGSTEKLVAIDGQEVTLEGGEKLTLSVLNLGSGSEGSGNQDGKPSALGENNQVIFTGRLDGRAYAVFYWPGRGDLIFKDGFESF